MDEAYAPFSIISLEKEDKYERTFAISQSERTYQVRLGADIDRVDLKDGSVRVIDYKSGKDAREIDQIEKLFDTTPGTTWKKGRNKAGFQTMFYAWLYAAKHGESHAIVPGLMNMQELFQEDFDYRLTMNNSPLSDARPHLSYFESKLEELLKEIYDADVPFDQTEDDRICTFCDFKGICGR